jgi:hypothetical protein
MLLCSFEKLRLTKNKQERATTYKQKQSKSYLAEENLELLKKIDEYGASANIIDLLQKCFSMFHCD